MSKKMKRVALDSSPYGVFGDDKARLKHQTLLQDYQELQKETEATITKLETMKQRKSTLLAEVRFLQRRHKYLMQTKSLNPPKEQLVKPRTSVIQPKNTVKKSIYDRKEATIRNLPPIFEPNQKDKKVKGKKVVLQNPPPVFDVNQKGKKSAKKAVIRNLPPVFDINQKEGIHSGKGTLALQNRNPIFDLNQKQLNQNERFYGAKEAMFHNPGVIFDLNQKERITFIKEAALRNPALVVDLNQKGRTYNGKEAVLQTRAAAFDLNQISRDEEEEEFQDSGEPPRNEEKMKTLSRGGSDEQHNDLKLSLCRNVGNGSNRAVGKRKISWQDQVALRV